MPARCPIKDSIIVATVSAPAHIHIQIDGLHWPSASLLVASMALVFTIGSFWWLNGRRGRLKSFEPHSFALGIMPADLVVLLRFPLVLYNTGATPIVVQDIRLTFPKESYATAPLPRRNTRSQIMPMPGEGTRFQPCSLFLVAPLSRCSSSLGDRSQV